MATDYFLQIAGIPGESLDNKHKDWIDVLSWSWGETHPAAPATGSGSGAAGKVQFQDFAFMTRVSKASPALFLACANGKHIKEATLVARKSGGKSQQEYLSWTFSDLLVTSYQTQGSSGDDTVVDSVSLNFSKAVVSYKAQKPDGSLDTPITVGWDAKKNAKI
jgi:type VI secretion system secreted protein Hcp